MRLISGRATGQRDAITTAIQRTAVPLHLGSIGAIGLCVVLWLRAKTVDQSARGNAERRALFVGLWPPMLWLLGDSAARVGTRR